jgi:hypothetical protein
MPPILESSQDLGVLIRFKCFLGPRAISGYDLFNIQYLKNILIIYSYLIYHQ